MTTIAHLDELRTRNVVGLTEHSPVLVPRDESGVNNATFWGKFDELTASFKTSMSLGFSARLASILTALHGHTSGHDHFSAEHWDRCQDGLSALEKSDTFAEGKTKTGRFMVDQEWLNECRDAISSLTQLLQLAQKKPFAGLPVTLPGNKRPSTVRQEASEAAMTMEEVRDKFGALVNLCSAHKTIGWGSPLANDDDEQQERAGKRRKTEGTSELQSVRWKGDLAFSQPVTFWQQFLTKHESAEAAHDSLVTALKSATERLTEPSGQASSLQRPSLIRQ